MKKPVMEEEIVAGIIALSVLVTVVTVVAIQSVARWLADIVANL